MNQTLKRYLVSTAVTFASVFFLTLGTAVSTLETAPEAITASTIVSLLVAALRTAFKWTIESLINKSAKSDERGTVQG